MTKSTDFQKLIDAACNNDLVTINDLVESGFDKESVNEHGNPILSEIIFNVLEDSKPHRNSIVSNLLKMGFNPNRLDSEGSGPLTDAMLAMDTKMLRVLLEGGALPNETSGFSDGETLYDWAEFDYAYEVWDIINLPEKLTKEALSGNDLWLNWIDALAVKYKRRRPDHLFLLREYGARGSAELNN